MLKPFVRRSALVLTLTLSAAPLAAIHAQAPSQILTGGNPMPTGEEMAAFAMLPLLSAMVSA